MQIIISSRVLKEALNALPGRVDCVRTEGEGEVIKVKFYSGEYFSIVECYGKYAKPFIDQANRRWDWVKDLANEVADQPVTLEILEEQVRIIFHY